MKHALRRLFNVSLVVVRFVVPNGESDKRECLRSCNARSAILAKDLVLLPTTVAVHGGPNLQFKRDDVCKYEVHVY